MNVAPRPFPILLGSSARDRMPLLDDLRRRFFPNEGWKAILACGALDDVQREIDRALDSDGATSERPVRFVFDLDEDDHDAGRFLVPLLELLRETARFRGRPVSTAIVVGIDSEPGKLHAELVARLESIESARAPVDSIVFVPKGTTPATRWNRMSVVLSLLSVRESTDHSETLGRRHLYRTAHATRISFDGRRLVEIGIQRILDRLRGLQSGSGSRTQGSFDSLAWALLSELTPPPVAPGSPTAADWISGQTPEPVATPIPARVENDAEARYLLGKLSIDFQLSLSRITMAVDQETTQAIADFEAAPRTNERKTVRLENRMFRALHDGILMGELTLDEVPDAVAACNRRVSDQFDETGLLELGSRAAALDSQRVLAQQAFEEELANESCPIPTLSPRLRKIRKLMNDEARTRAALGALRGHQDQLSRFARSARDAGKKLEAIRRVVEALPSFHSPLAFDHSDPWHFGPGARLEEEVGARAEALVNGWLRANRESLQTTIPEAVTRRGSVLPPVTGFPKEGAAELFDRIRKVAADLAEETLGEGPHLTGIATAMEEWRSGARRPLPFAIDEVRVTGETSLEPAKGETVVLASPRLLPVLAPAAASGRATDVGITSTEAALRVQFSKHLPLAAFELFAGYLGQSPILPSTTLDQFRVRLLELAWENPDPAAVLGVLAAWDDFGLLVSIGIPRGTERLASRLLEELPATGLPRGTHLAAAQLVLRLAAADGVESMTRALFDRTGVDGELDALVAPLDVSADRLLRPRPLARGGVEDGCTALESLSAAATAAAILGRRSLVSLERKLIVPILEKLSLSAQQERNRRLGLVFIQVPGEPPCGVSPDSFRTPLSRAALWEKAFGA